MTGATNKLRPSAVWDRFFWSFMVTIFVGLVWMKFLQETARFESVGYIVAIGIGMLWFWRGIRRLRRSED
ncbi:MAG: hypothetical protein U9R51_03260 [Actinomycetota bacterium]|nr:hypothetical protein [Actinomycetota bacterium]